MRHFILAAACLILAACATVTPPPEFNTNSAAPIELLENYDQGRAIDPAPVVPSNVYNGSLTSIYDVDTLELTYKFGQDVQRTNIRSRLAGLNGYEVTRRGGTTAQEVQYGFQCRDYLLDWLGYTGDPLPYKAKYHPIDPPLDVIIQGMLDDGAGKFGRPLVIIWSTTEPSVNVNQLAIRSGCAEPTWYDKKTYDRWDPVVPR